MNKIKKAKLEGYFWGCNECNKEFISLSKEQIEGWIVQHMTLKHNKTTNEVLAKLE